MTFAVTAALAVSFVWAGCSPSSPSSSDSAADGDTVARVAESAPIDLPAAPGAMAPELVRLQAPGGAEVALTWLEPVPEPAAGPEPPATEPATEEEAAWRLRFARRGPDGWSDPVTIVSGGSDGGGIPGETAPLFANWADRPGAVQAARPARSGAPEAPSGAPATASGADTGPLPLFAHWLAMNGGSTYAYEVRMARSDDGGLTWHPLGRLHSDDQAAEHGFVSYVTDPRADGTVPGEGTVRAVWLDGRATPDGGPMTVRTALVGERVHRETEELLDDSVCDCCSTTAVATPTGPLVVYRDRTADEVRDHWLVRGTSGGADAPGGWTAPEPLHQDGWTIAACPVNGPAAGVSEDGGTVWIAWFTAADGEPRVRVAVSTDGGESFGDPVEVDGPETGAPLGRLDLAVVHGAEGGAEEPGAVISWLDREGGDAVIRLRRVSADGLLGPTVDVARSATSRATGVPRLLALPEEGGTRLLVTWVDPGGSEEGDDRRIRLVGLAASQVPSPDPG